MYIAIRIVYIMIIITLNIIAFFGPILSTIIPIRIPPKISPTPRQIIA